MRPEDFPELGVYESNFNPSAGGGRRPGLETLPDGDHDFEILSAELTRTEKTNEAIFRMELRTGGSVVEHAYFFRTQMSVDILGGDLCALGFDADQWKPPHRPLVRELLTAAPKLRGIRFRGKKVTKPKEGDPNKKYVNLYVNQRLSADAPPPSYTPAPSGFDPFNGAASDPFAAANSNDDIPF